MKTKQKNYQKKEVKNEKRSEVEIRTFGTFTIYINGKIFRCSRRKAEEVLAYLIDKDGHIVNKEELMLYVYNCQTEDKEVENNVHVHLVALKKELSEAGAGHIINIEKDSYSVNVGTFKCDYFDFLSNKMEEVRRDPANYMQGYSWANITCSFLVNKYQAYLNKVLNGFAKDE